MGRFCQIGEIQQVVPMGRMTALKKATGVRGFVAGDIVRRFVAKTISHQIRVQVEKATAPFHYALSTRRGVSALPMHFVSSYDSISRVAMMRGLRQMEWGRRSFAVRESVLWFPLHLSLGR